EGTQLISISVFVVNIHRYDKIIHIGIWISTKISSLLQDLVFLIAPIDGIEDLKVIGVFDEVFGIIAPTQDFVDIHFAQAQEGRQGFPVVFLLEQVADFIVFAHLFQLAHLPWFVSKNMVKEIRRVEDGA